MAEFGIVLSDSIQDRTSKTAMALLIHSYVFLLAFVYAPATGMSNCQSAQTEVAPSVFPDAPFFSLTA